MEKKLECKIIVPYVLVTRCNNSRHYIVCNFYDKKFQSCYETIMDLVEGLNHTQQWHIAQLKSANSNACKFLFSFLHVHGEKKLYFGKLE